MEYENITGKIIGASIEAFAPVHEAIILTYMKFAGMTVESLITFNVTVLKNGLKRYVL